MSKRYKSVAIDSCSKCGFFKTHFVQGRFNDPFCGYSYTESEIQTFMATGDGPDLGQGALPSGVNYVCEGAPIPIWCKLPGVQCVVGADTQIDWETVRTGQHSTWNWWEVELIMNEQKDTFLIKTDAQNKQDAASEILNTKGRYGAMIQSIKVVTMD